MRLAWSTDLHLDFLHPKASRLFGEEVRDEQDADALVLTGDIGTASTVSNILIDIAAGFGKPIYFVLGNHDIYGQSFADAAHKAERLTRTHSLITWLTQAGVVRLSHTTALVGHDGWYDARHGACDPPRVTMGCWDEIKDFRRPWRSNLGREERLSIVLRMCRDRADRIALEFEPVVRAAVGGHQRTVVATHVPPFPENGVYTGRDSDPGYGADDWLPYYVNKAMGDMLLRVATDHPDRDILVLCGHAHQEHDHMIRPNLRVRTGPAQYRTPPLIAATLDL